MAGPYTPPKLADTPLPELFSHIAQQNPHRPYVQILREHVGGPTECTRYTWAEVIQHAQNSAADLIDRWTKSLKDETTKKHIVEPRRPGTQPVVVAVLGNNGYGLYVNILACMLNRWTALLISPKNSPAAIEHLLGTSKSSLFLVEPANTSLGHQMEQKMPGLTALTLATLDSPRTGPAPSPLTSLSQEELKKEMELPALYLHTSGSTGHPKVVPWSHEFLLSTTRLRLRDSKDWVGLPYYSMPPIIHAIGVVVYFTFPLAHANLFTFVVSPTPKPPSAGTLLTCLPFIKGGIAFVAPSILEDLHNLGPDAVQEVADNTRLVVYGGAPLNAATGNALVAAGINLTAAYGSTEANMCSKQVSDKKPEDWEYIYFREGYTWHFLPIDDDSNLRELIIGPGTDGSPAVINHENPRGYATSDVWEPHPTVPNLWRHHSRKGDVTVLSNGEKSDNKQIEDLLLRDKRILHVQVFGAGRAMNGVIIQPSDPSVPIPEFLTQIQPTIEHANGVLPKHSRLLPELLIVASPDRPMATTDKGTVKKKETLDRFEQDIERAYEASEEGGEWTFEGSVDNSENVKKFLRSTIKAILGVDVPDDGDVFEKGMDSLYATRLRQAVMSVVRKTMTSSDPVPRNIVYTFPSINALTGYLLSRAAPDTSDPQGGIEERIRQSISKFSANFVPHKKGSWVPHRKTVALSGSTGSVGSSIVRVLLERDDVDKVYLLNRKGSESQVVRQARGLEEKGFDPKILDANKEKIVYLDVDFSRKDLGLSDKEYSELRDNVTHIIHAAWHLNFNLILESYERVHIAGVRNLIDLALSSPQAQPPHLTFLSTIAAAAMYRGPTQEPSIGERAGQVIVPEEPIDDPGIVMNQGYGQSKYVSERVIVNAVGAGLRATITRVGQMSGVTTNGAWPTTEHVPIMLRSSLALGMVPDDLPPVRWMPSDTAASAIVKQAFEISPSLNYFSIENPFPTEWKIVVEALSKVSPKPLRLVTLAAWLEHIRKSKSDPKEVPAIKLLEFYQTQEAESVTLGWEKSVKLAPELAADPITRDLVEKYVVYQQGKMQL